MDHDVVYVYHEGSPRDLFSEYHIHHGLEGRWWIGESKKHYCRFEESLICYEGCFVSIFFDYLDCVVSPVDVDYCDQFSITDLVD